MSLTSGTKLGPNEIVALLGAGGMGEVYRARDTRLDRTVAIKVLIRSVGADPDRGNARRTPRLSREVSVLYEGDALIVLNKPALAGCPLD
jgi:serine/threonine protein kinase